MTQTPVAARSVRQPGHLVYLAGVGTSLLALWLVQVCGRHDMNPMGWYIDGILPAGALFVGILSGVGYAIASRYFEVKLTKVFVIGMLVTGVVDYAAMQYFTYTDLLEAHNATSAQYSFIQYMRDITEHMTFQTSGSSTAGSELGMGGYFFKLLELAGFAGGTMIPSAVLFKMAYCSHCQRYLKKILDGHLHSNMLKGEMFRMSGKQRPGAIEAGVSEVSSRAGQVVEQARAADLEGTKAIVDGLERPLRKDALARITVSLWKCPDCDNHRLTLLLYYATANKKFATKNLPALDKTAPARAVAA